MEEKLTKETYRTNHEYMSYSRLVSYSKCEAAALAGYREPSSKAQLIGSYVDAHFSKELEEFEKEHPEIYNSKTGELKVDFIQANDIIARAEKDKVFSYYMSGEKQVIMTGVIEGIKFKIKMDSFMPGKFIADLKVVKDFKKVWSDTLKSYTNFIEAYDYDIELAIFQEVVRQNTEIILPCYIPAITKEVPSDIDVFYLRQEMLDEALNYVKKVLIPRYKKLIAGEVAPHRCEKCAYCRGTKKARVISSEYVGFDGDMLREVGIECDDEKVERKE